jgi:hypothetical protein
MKKNLNIIRINGIRGLCMAGLIATCFAAGFIAFPGWVAMHLWNVLAAHYVGIPYVGILQGILLWGIIVALYFMLKKDRVVVCVKTPQGLSEEELKAVFADMKKQAEEDPILQSMLKARESELKNIQEQTYTTKVVPDKTTAQTPQTKQEESHKV